MRIFSLAAQKGDAPNSSWWSTTNRRPVHPLAARPIGESNACLHVLRRQGNNRVSAFPRGRNTVPVRRMGKGGRRFVVLHHEALVLEGPEAVRARHHVQVIQVVAVRCCHGVIALGHHHHVVVFYGAGLVDAAVVAWDALVPQPERLEVVPLRSELMLIKVCPYA